MIFHKQAKLFTLLLFIASLLLTLILGEVVLRFTGKVKMPPIPPITTTKPEHFQEYKPYGYRLWPSLSTTYYYPKNNPRKLHLISNSYGFRSQREFDEPDVRTRILVVGDSFVYGEGVEESERFTNTIETNQHLWRVDSLGMIGFGPGLMIRALEEVGLRTHVDVVVFCMYTDDFRRVLPYYAGAGFEIPRFTLTSGQLVTISYPKLHIWGKSHLFQAIRHVYWKHTNATYDLNEAILNRFLKLANLHKFAPAIIFLPGTHDTQTDKQRRNWLREYSLRNKTPYLDLTEQIHGAGRKNVFIKNNWHYNPKGHKIVAQELSNFLSKDVLKNQ